MFYLTHMTFSLFLSLLLYAWVPGLLGSIPPMEWYTVAILSSALPDWGHIMDQLGFGRSNNGLITHSMLGIGAFTVAFGLLSWSLGIGMVPVIPFIFGYASHLMTDSMKPAGINWLWPLKAKWYSIGNIRTGSRAEAVFEATITVGILSVVLL